MEGDDANPDVKNKEGDLQADDQEKRKKDGKAVTVITDQKQVKRMDRDEVIVVHVNPIFVADNDKYYNSDALDGCGNDATEAEIDFCDCCILCCPSNCDDCGCEGDEDLGGVCDGICDGGCD